jgi:hypothetical protein
MTFLAMLLSCSGKNSGANGGKNAANKNVYFPYSPIYTSSYSGGNPEHAKAALEVCRAYDRGNLLAVRKLFSDSVKMTFSDWEIKGGKDSVLRVWQKRRHTYTYIQTSVYSWMPVHAPDKNEDLVYVWLRQVSTLHSGKILYNALHQVWRFNKKGQIENLQQFNSKVN